eukprot:15476757-Alexandrium_andersonii.AAC.1
MPLSTEHVPYKPCPAAHRPPALQRAYIQKAMDHLRGVLYPPKPATVRPYMLVPWRPAVPRYVPTPPKVAGPGVPPPRARPPPKVAGPRPPAEP